MNVKNEIIKLHKKGIYLWKEKGNLHYKSVAQKIGNDDMRFLMENKKAILKLFEENSDKYFQMNDDREHEEYPLTDIQTAYLLGRGENFKYGGVSSHVYFEVIFPRLTYDETKRIWNILINRHDNLRLVITENQCQKVLQEVPLFEPIWNENECGNEESEAITEIRDYLENRYYDVKKWPLFDIGISQIKEKSIMHLSFDFLALDWTSIWILLKEFECLYFGNKELPKIQQSFRDYCYEVNEKKKSSQYFVDEEYWKEQIVELPEPPMLPITNGKVGNKFKRLSENIGINEWNKIKNSASKEGLTPTIVTLAAFALSIEPWCEKSEFVLNLTTMNRNGADKKMDYIVGDFTAVNLLSVEAERENTFLENARLLQNRLIKNLEHNLFSGVEVLRELRRIHLEEDYLLPIVFTSSIGSVSFDYEDLEIGKYGISQTPQVFLDCQVMEINGKLQINIDIREGIFPDKMIEHIMCRFHDILILLSQMRNWNSKIDIGLVEQEKNERIQANSTSEAFEINTLDRTVFEQIEKHPNNIAIIKGNVQTTYSMLGKKVAGIISQLESVGIGNQERVAIMMKHSDTEVAAILAVLALGGVYIPIDIEQPEQRIKNIIEQAEIRCVLTDQNNIIIDEKANIIISCNNLLGNTIPKKLLSKVDDLAYIIFTSGTTGQPKGVEISHRAAENTIISVNKLLDIPDRPVVLGLSKINFDLSVYDIFGILSKGGTIVYPEEENRVNPHDWIELITKYEVNVWNTVPALMQLLVSYMNSHEIPAKLSFEKVLLSGDWIPVTLPDEIKKIAPYCQVISLGGATEASIWSIYHICDNCESNRKSIPYGKPLSNQKFYVLDKNFQDKPVWASGELYIAGQGLARGYVRDKKQTNNSFLVHPLTGEKIYRTGDYGRYLPGGEIEFLGRKDNQIKINGYRIELGEIEAGLLNNPMVKEASVIYDSKKEEKKLVGFICPKKRKNIGENRNQQLKDCIKKYSNDYQGKIAATKEELQEIIEIRDKLALNGLIEALQALGFFIDEREYQLNEILNSVVIPEEYQWIVCYWLHQLSQQGYLLMTGNKFKIGNYDVVSSYSWEDLKAKWRKYIGNDDFISYIEKSKNMICDCLNNSTNPVDILYPEGSTKIVKSIYEDNIFAQYFNDCIAEFVASVATKARKRLRILEIGAGTGFTSKKILNSLMAENLDYQYYFTDITNSFLARAKSNLSDYPNIYYSIYDINKGYEEQGFVPNEFDIVIAVGVLENAKDIKKSLSYIRELLSINGWLIFTEPIVEEPWILVSQIFMMERPMDGMRKTSSYIDQTKWEELLESLSEVNDSTVILPEESDKIASGNMRLFAKQFNISYELLEETEIISNLKQYVPEYMVPSNIHILSHIPLNSNEKIDRKKLVNYSRIISGQEARKECITIYQEMKDSTFLERALCSIAANILGMERLNPTDNLYNFGADSLLMAQAAGSIRDYVETDLSNSSVTFDMILRQLLNDPNIRNLSKFIEKKIQDQNSKIICPEEQSEKIGKLTSYGGGEGTLRVVFHAGFGTMNSMKYVIKELVEQQKGTVISITIDNNEKYCSLPDEELVSVISQEYSELIINCNPDKVQLIGYCLGGLIAIETAHHLINAGIEIEDISLIDSYPAPYKILDNLISEAIFLPNFYTSYGKIYSDITDEELMTMIGEVLEICRGGVEENQLLNYVMSKENIKSETKALIKRLSGLTIEERFEEYSKSIDEGNKELLLTTYKTNSASWRGAKMIPFPYFGHVRFLLAEEKMDFLFAEIDETLEFWRDVCLGGLEVITIPGNHVTCAEDEENAKKMAVILGNPL